MSTPFETELRRLLASAALEDEQGQPTQDVAVTALPPLQIVAMPKRKPWRAVVQRDRFGLIESVVMTPLDD